ncbi:hypothetical protein [Azospirillum halopraeferens]|uniref:hypothetical protein n=1 Tax=Azospirillum halopraeferens TaxID=34010 RepID=UPI000418FF2D|nr:hypothetical protein [Azospirillum halopraeferens]
MAHESMKSPVSPKPLRTEDRGIDETRARHDADRADTADSTTGAERRLKAEREGRHIRATDASGKPYGHDDDPDVHEDGVSRTGGPGNVP